MQVLKSDPATQLAEIQAEEDRRAQEGLKCYRPAKQMPFHLATAPELILSGGKRSGKTTGVAAEFASRVLGVAIQGPHNRPIKRRYPVSTKKDPHLYWIIGWDVDHIGQTMFHKLFSPGLFRIIRDKATGRWRTYNPAIEDDAERYMESRPCGPLIPERFIDTSRGVKGWSWENRGANNFSAVYLKNGATICAYPSSSKHAKMGDAVSGIWIDEDIQNPSHLKEWQDRLTDRNGWLLWSVWPHTRNDALIQLIDRAAECQGDEEPPIEHYQLVMSENPFIPEKNKRLALGRMGSEEEIARRDRGDLLLDTISMYDFAPAVHCIKQHDRHHHVIDDSPVKAIITRVWNERGLFPRDWTRYMAVDPSHTRTAVVFGVVPPLMVDDTDVGDMLIVEKELIVHKHSAPMLAGKIREMVAGLNYEAFIMDQQIGRQTRVGTDTTVFQIYAKALAEVKVASRTTQSSFVPGCNVPTTRYNAVRDMMALSDRGCPRLLLVESKTYGLQREFNSYRKKQVFMAGAETIMDEPANPRKHDAMAALEYLCAYVYPLMDAGTAYVSPDAYGGGGSPAYRRAQRILLKQKESREEYVHLGPGSTAALV